MLNAAPVDLSGKRCLITGANGGIGNATAEHFFTLGAHIYTTDIGENFIGEFKSEYRPFNLLNRVELNNCLEWIEECRPDIVFNNAGLFDMGSVLEADLDQYERLFTVNVKAMYASFC